MSTYTFDPFGQRISQGPASSPTSATFAYTGTGRLAAYRSAASSATYSYDAAGQRTRSVVATSGGTTTTTYLCEGLSLLSLSATRVAEGSVAETWTVSYLYDAEGRPYAGVYSSTTTTPTVFQVVTSDRGDVVELLSGSGEAFASYRYDVWGVASTPTSRSVSGMTTQVASAITGRQPLRYAGYCYDAESQMYYCSARTYDPATRQFLSKDPARDDGEESAYQYCGGDPVGKVDPSGLWNEFVHFSLTRFWASQEGMSMANAMVIAKGDVYVDQAPAYHGSATKGTYRYHFGAYGCWGVASSFYKSAVFKWKRHQRPSALFFLGMALHCRQDYYGHGGKAGSWRTHWPKIDHWGYAGRGWYRGRQRQLDTEATTKDLIRSFKQATRS